MADEVRDRVEFQHLHAKLLDHAGAATPHPVDSLDAVATRILPELRDRPLTVLRVRPGQQPFMQKNLPTYAPAWIPTVTVWAQASQREVHYPLCHDRRTLLWFAGQRAVEFHPTVLDGEGRVTYLVLDLDPPEGAGFDAVIRAAHLVREALTASGLSASAKTSGSKGIHVVVPITPRTPVEDAMAATRALAARTERLDPAAVTTAFLKEERQGRVYVDPTRSGGASLACTYSPRARPGVPVSFPVAWSDLDAVAPSDFTVRTAPGLLGDADPWRASLPEPQQLPDDLVAEGHAIPVPRVVAMHEGKRRARARRQA